MLIHCKVKDLYDLSIQFSQLTVRFSFIAFAAYDSAKPFQLSAFLPGSLWGTEAELTLGHDDAVVRTDGIRRRVCLGIVDSVSPFLSAEYVVNLAKVSGWRFPGPKGACSFFERCVCGE